MPRPLPDQSGNDWEVLVVGAGAAGLMAATRTAQRGLRTLLLEKNSKPGVKILMSGGTRCNITQATDRQGIADAFERQQGRFLRGPLAALGPDELIALLARAGLATKIEATNKVFPASDRALDVQRTLLQQLDRAGASLALNEAVGEITPQTTGFHVTTDRRTLHSRALILATGGRSYPGCGTTGDGYAWLRRLGHSIVSPRPALVPLQTAARWSHALSGVTLSDVVVSIVDTQQSKPLARQRGALLFTHVGLSGPAVMNLSRLVSQAPQTTAVRLECDFLPELPQQGVLDALQNAPGKKQVARLIGQWLPHRVVDALLAQAKIPAGRTVAEFSKAERKTLLQRLKSCQFSVSGTLGFAKAEVTAGGVALAEVDSRTMQSKRLAGLYIVGELLDIDGPIGGYNFQAAFSTGWLAGDSILR